MTIETLCAGILPGAAGDRGQRKINRIMPGSQRHMPDRTDHSLAAEAAGRVPAWSVLFRKGSLTVEACLIVPIFWIVLAGFMCFLLLMRMEEDVAQALTETAAEAAGLSYAAEEHTTGETVLADTIFYTKLNHTANDPLALSLVKGGKAGIMIFRSRVSEDQALISLTADYLYKTPWSFFGIGAMHIRQTQCCRGWIGYTGDDFGVTEEAEETVYITPYGTVYHTSTACPFLDLSIHTVDGSEAQSLTNKSGAHYYACEDCHPSDGGDVYITDYGNRYHASLSCSGLKRTISAIPISEAGSRHQCSKCRTL